jgi:hypothetical protein
MMFSILIIYLHILAKVIKYKLIFFWSDVLMCLKVRVFKTGNGELLELRLLETGFLSRFQLNP